MNKNKPIKKVVVENSESQSESELLEIASKATKKEVVQGKKVSKQALAQKQDQEETPVVGKKGKSRKDDQSSVSKEKTKKQVITNTGPVRKSSVDDKKKKTQKKQSSEEDQSENQQKVVKKPIVAKVIVKAVHKNVHKDAISQEESSESKQKQVKGKGKEQPKKQLPKKIPTEESQESEEPEVKPKNTKVKKVEKKPEPMDQEESEDIIVDKKKKAQKPKPKEPSESQEESQQPVKNKNVKKVVSPKTQPLPTKNVKKAPLEEEEQSEEKVPSRKSSKDIKKKQVKRIANESEEEESVKKVPAKKVEKVVEEVKVNPTKSSKDQLKIVGKKVQEDQQGQFEVCVRQLSYDAYDQDIRQHFKDCGQILNVKLLLKPDGKSKGIAFVKFGLRSQLNKALELNGSEIMGRPINVEEALKRQNNQGNQGNSSFGGRQNSKDNKFNNNRGPVTINNPNLYVGGLSYSTTQDGLRSFFSQIGTVVGARVITEKDTGNPRGFGYVEFTTVDEAKKAYEQLNGQSLDGRKIRIDSAEPRPPRPEGGGGRSFSGGRGAPRNQGNSHVDLSVDDKNAKSGTIGTFQGKRIIL